MASGSAVKPSIGNLKLKLYKTLKKILKSWDESETDCNGYPATLSGYSKKWISSPSFAELNPHDPYHFSRS